MASRCRRYRPGRLQALKDNPELLVIRPSSPSAGLDDLQPFNLSTVLMAVHKHCYTSLKLTQQGGPGRRETKVETKSFIVRPRENSRKVPTNPMKATIELRIVKGGYDFTFDWICCKLH
jgi:hypothetical protein